MSHSHCLNCETLLIDKYCHKCGQKADTHRITAKHFIMHDMVHGVWHLDKGMLYTLKQAIVRPGYAATEYISGKRVKFYNIFYLSLIIMTLMLISDNYLHSGAFSAGSYGSEKTSNGYYKLIMLSFIPMFAISSFFVFRKLRLNFFEHIVLAGFTLLGMYVCLLGGVTLGPFEDNYYIIKLLNLCIGAACLLYPVISYYQATRRYYSFFGFIWRMLLIYFFVALQVWAIKLLFG